MNWKQLKNIKEKERKRKESKEIGSATLNSYKPSKRKVIKKGILFYFVWKCQIIKVESLKKWKVETMELKNFWKGIESKLQRVASRSKTCSVLRRHTWEGKINSTWKAASYFVLIWNRIFHCPPREENRSAVGQHCLTCHVE